MGAVHAFVTYEDSGPCAECGVSVWLPANMLRQRREKGGTFFCPNGHSLAYTETEVKKLRAELELKQKQLDSRQKSLEWERQRTKTAEKSRDAYKGKVTEIKNRVGNGVCPCCRRSFQNLRRHMSCKHPDFKETP